MRVRSFPEAQARYGLIKDGKWAEEDSWCVLVEFSPKISDSWINSLSGQPTRHIYCNKDMAPALLHALQNVLDRGLVSELKTFDGCFAIRDVRALPGHPSTHTYALAIDINAADNRLGKEPTLSPEFVACFTEAGFSWGGNFARRDGMHFSYAWE